MIGACATIMMAGRALTVGAPKGPAWLARRRNAPTPNSSVTPVTPVTIDNGNGLAAGVALPDLSR